MASVALDRGGTEEADEWLERIADLGGWCRTADTSVGFAGWVGRRGSHAGRAGTWSRFG
jgi:hypothetical protein